MRASSRTVVVQAYMLHRHSTTVCCWLQVLTRFLTSCPALPLFMARNVVYGSTVTSRLTLAYCATWLILGLIMFTNFYPWT